MIRLFSQMLSRPVVAFTSGVELLGQRIKAGQRIDGVVSRIVHALSGAPNSSSGGQEQMRPPTPAPLARQEQLLRIEATPEAEVETDEAPGRGFDPPDLMDTDLSGEMLKLVRYQVLFVRRDCEHAFAETEAMIAESLDGEAFTAWKIAEFMQALGRGEIPIPERWRNKHYPPQECIRDGKLIDLPPEDRKYLRLKYEVLDRYPRQSFNHEKRQVRVLKQIRDAIAPSDR